MPKSKQPHLLLLAAGLTSAAALLWAALAVGPERPLLASGATCTPSRPHVSGTSVESLTTAGGPRSYRLHVPPSYTGMDPVPLVLNFHGLGSTAAEQEAYSGVSARADEPDGGFIVVYPDGLLLGGPDTQWWNVIQLPSPQPDDVAFVDSLLDTLEAQLCIDATRVFSTGMSNGALMSSRLACSLSNRIAAIAPVAGAYYPPAFTQPFPNDTCPDTRPVPLISFHGTADTSVPFNGGTGTGGLTFRLPIDDEVPGPDVMSEWAAHNGCTGARQEMPLTDQIDLVRYDGCTNGATVDLYVVNGGGHTWPDSFDVPSLGKTTHDINANDLLWAFFQQHPFGQEVAPTPTPTPKDPLGDPDGDTVPNPSDPDDDNDGCTDVDELQTAKSSFISGGRRDPHHFWDFFDTPNANNVRDKSIAAPDFFAILGRFGAAGDPGADPLAPPPPAPEYHTAFDRTAPAPGADPWDTGPPDGAVSAPDFFLVLAQFGHSCA